MRGSFLRCGDKPEFSHENRRLRASPYLPFSLHSSLPRRVSICIEIEVGDLGLRRDGEARYGERKSYMFRAWEIRIGNGKTALSSCDTLLMCMSLSRLKWDERRLPSPTSVFGVGMQFSREN